MAYFHTTVLDNQIKTLPTYKTASGSVATFETDMTENLVDVKCQIVAQQSGSGTPSPSNPRPIQTYTSLNLSHSGSDTSNPTVYNIPFGQTVANGVLDITTGKLRVTDVDADMGTLPWVLAATSTGHWWFRANVPNVAKAGGGSIIPDIKCEVYQTITPNSAYQGNMGITSNAGADDYLHVTDENYSDATSFTGAVNGKKVVYKLATPIEIQLDSITLQALLNENNIWCDTGDITAKYILSVGEALRQA